MACHFPGQIGAHPKEPATASLLGLDAQGNADASGTVTDHDKLSHPGYSDTWYDLDKKSFARG